MRSKSGVFRAGALLTVGAIAVHQLRFMLGYGSSASEALAEQGHSYLPFTEAVAAVIVGSALLWFARSLYLAHSGRIVEAKPLPFGRLWTCATGALIAVYTLQEGFEGELSPGHPAGIVGVFGHGGWTAIPLALAIGALIALLLEGAHRAITVVGSRSRRTLPRPPKAHWTRLPVGFPKLEVLTYSLAARGPPLSS